MKIEKLKVLKKNPYFDPRCCTYKLGGKIRNHVERLIDSENVEQATKSILKDLMDEDEANKNTLCYDSLVKLHKFIQRADQNYSDPFYLFSEACKCIEPKPRENKELDSRLRLLRLRQSQATYNNMTACVDRIVEDKLEKMAEKENLSSSTVYSTLNNNNNTNNEGQNQLSEFRKLNGSVIAVFNSFLVCICTFIFFYKVCEYSLMEPNIIAQVLFGLSGSLIVAIAELYFIFRVI